MILFFLAPIITIRDSNDVDNYCKGGKADDDVNVGMSLLEDIYVAKEHHCIHYSWIEVSLFNLVN